MVNDPFFESDLAVFVGLVSVGSGPESFVTDLVAVAAVLQEPVFARESGFVCYWLSLRWPA